MSRTLLVIPHYNDTERLKPFLRELISILPSRFSILVSDDGSETVERDKLSKLIANVKSGRGENSPELMEPLFTTKNTGKGGAVYRGWDACSEFSFISFVDADGAICASEILRMESYFRSDECRADAIFGSRIRMLGRSVTRSLLRHLTGRVFATIVSEVGNIPVYDTQCGFKIMSQEAFKKIQPYLKTFGFAFDVELTILLLETGSKVIEYPIDWCDVGGTKVSLFRHPIRMLLEVNEIRSRLLKK